MEKINRTCFCLKSKRGYFVAGRSYKVLSIWQEQSGVFMVEVIDEGKWCVKAHASRFRIYGGNE